MCGCVKLSIGAWVAFQGPHPYRKLTIPQQPSVANSCSVKGGTSWPPPYSMWAFCLAWSSTWFMLVVSASVSSYMLLPNCVQKTLIVCRHEPRLALQTICEVFLVFSLRDLEAMPDSKQDPPLASCLNGVLGKLWLALTYCREHMAPRI